MSLILTTFLPTILMNIIGHMSNYFKEDFFEGLMAMNVTVMLVLTTLFLRKVFQQCDVIYLLNIFVISVNTNLANTAYIKMLDCWLIFSLLKPFVDIIVQTYIHTLRQEYQETPVTEAWSKNQRNWKIVFWQTFVRVVYPVFFLIFIVIFWLVGLVYYIIL